MPRCGSDSAYLEERAIERLRAFFRFSALVVFGASVVAGSALHLVTGLGLTSMRPSMAPGVGLLIFPIAALGRARGRTVEDSAQDRCRPVL